MGSPYTGEIRLVGFNFAPVGWALCNGQPMAISQNEALFQLIGTIYGGDGQSSFVLPDLRSRVAVHQGVQQGTSYVIGETGGAESVALTTNQIPSHMHALNAAADGQTATPGPGVVLGTPVSIDHVYAPQGVNQPTPLSPNSVAVAGSNQPHENRMPFLTINYIVCLYGIFPTQS
jgi:microcystin-dependent protein